MNEKKAKRIRKMVYGEGSKRNEKEYTRDEKTGQLRAIGKRATYLKAKKEAK